MFSCGNHHAFCDIMMKLGKKLAFDAFFWIREWHMQQHQPFPKKYILLKITRASVFLLKPLQRQWRHSFQNVMLIKCRWDVQWQQKVTWNLYHPAFSVHYKVVQISIRQERSSYDIWFEHHEHLLFCRFYMRHSFFSDTNVKIIVQSRNVN